MSRLGSLRGRLAQEIHGIYGRDLSVAFVGHLLANGVGTLTFLIITPVLGPQGYGVFMLAFSVFEIALYLSDLGLDIGLTRFLSRAIRNQDEASVERVMKAVFIAKLSTGVVVFVAGFLTAPWLAGLMLSTSNQVVVKPELLASFLRIMFVRIFGHQLTGFYQSYFGARLEFARNAVFTALAPVVILAAVVVHQWLGMLDVAATVRIYAVAPIAVCALAFLALPHKFFRAQDGMAGSLNEVWRFSRWIYLTNVLASVRYRLNSILLSRYATLHQVGLYNYADKWASTITLFTSSIMTVFVPRASHLASRDELQVLLRRSYRWMLLLAPVLLVVPLLARPLIRLHDASFLDAAPVFVILFLSVILTLVALPSRTVLYSVDRPQVETGVELVALSLTLITGYFLVRSQGAVGASVAMLLQRFFSSFFTITWVYVTVYRRSERAA